jgi:hypothetical protein
LNRHVEWLTRYGPPHLTWLVAALLVQRDRQRWHHEVTRRLYESDEDEGEVPDLPGWTYYRHGAGICLCAPDGERLDVDFNDPDGAIIDPWFFAARVASLQDAGAWLAERRLWRWRPTRDVIVDGIEELAELGAVTYQEYKNRALLAPELEARARAVAAELAAPSSHERWLAALEPGGEAAHVAQHRAWIRERLRTSPRPGDLLDLALDGATADEAVELCRPLLARKDWAAGHAIELLRARPDTPPLPEIPALLRTASLTEDHPFAPYHACAYLLERGLERELVLDRFDAWSQLEQAKGYGGNPMASELAILALRELPDRALPLVRRSLRSSVPLCVHAMAALLAAIDQRWCHRELAAALAEPRVASHSYLAAALRSTSSELARRRADADPGPPPRAPDAIGYTFDEVLHASADRELGDELDTWRDLAAVLRARYPDDWTGG